MKAKERVAALLLVLMNEKLPAGVVRDVVLRARAIDDRDFEAHAELAAAAYREAHYLLDGTDEPEPEEEKDDDEPPALQAVEAVEGGGVKPLGSEVFDEPMLKWLDIFDDRIGGSEHFVEAVNEAVEAGRPATEATAQLVAERVHELALQAQGRELAGER